MTEKEETQIEIESVPNPKEYPYDVQMDENVASAAT
jgi:hypothetical protein